MDNDLINSQATGPIVRSTNAQRLATFQANANSIYNKFTPFTTYSFGPSQPFIFTKVSDSTFFKNFTKYDSQVAPIGSTIRDVKRIGQYLITGNGLLFVGKQLLLQQQNAFNETRIYNPLSVLKATLKPGSLGAIDYPKRHLETSGGLLNFFKDASLSTIGYETKDAEKTRIQGTATGIDDKAYSPYAGSLGGARAGMLRLGTAKSAISKFQSRWPAEDAESKTGNTDGGFLAKLKSMIPSTNPLGIFGGKESDTWKFRPEYKTKENGAYYAFLADKSGFLTVNERASQLFYNDGTYANANAAGKATVLLASNYHKYYPQKQDVKSTRIWYADKVKITNDKVGVKDGDTHTNNLKDLHGRMIKSIASFKDEKNQFRRSAERYAEVKGVKYMPYKDIPDKTNLNNGKNTFETDMLQTGVTMLKQRMFAKASSYDDVNKNQKVSDDAVDGYNAFDVLDGKRGAIPDDLSLKGTNQSKDLIYFFFFDLINNKYIPFRATLSSVSDQHTGDWEDVSYLGRADKLFLYKGFSRDVSFGFRVYANSAKEMLPMWNRINYLVGLTRPSKYTPKATVSNEDTIAMNEFASDLGLGDNYIDTSGRESRFIYPPMVTLTMGDLYVDQPCVLSSVSVNIPDDSLWESLRADNYEYVYGKDKKISMLKVKSRQLPTIVDVSVNIKMLEKRLSLGSDAHFGRSDGQGNRWI
jgi:hypothetical protein